MLSIRNFYIRLLCFAVFLALCLLSLAIPAAAKEADTAETIYTCAVHYSADLDSMVIGHLEDGTKLTVLDTYETFYKIDCYDMTGYIAKEQVRVDSSGEYYVNCKDAFPDTRATQYVALAQALSVRSAVMDLADDQLGVPYLMGGTTPSAFDCSGFVSYVFSNNGFSIRRTVTQQLQDGVIISREALQPGDLVFFRTGSGFSSHVGIYAGDNQMIHAGNAGIGYADLDNSYFSSRYLCCRRMINVDISAPQQLSSAVSMLFSRNTDGLRTIPLTPFPAV